MSNWQTSHDAPRVGLMVMSEPIAVFARKTPQNREWLEEDFFDTPPTKKAMRHLAEHYSDIARNNTVCTDEDRAEFRRRARHLTRMARELT